MSEIKRSLNLDFETEEYKLLNSLHEALYNLSQWYRSEYGKPVGPIIFNISYDSYEIKKIKMNDSRGGEI